MVGEERILTMNSNILFDYDDFEYYKGKMTSKGTTWVSLGRRPMLDTVYADRVSGKLYYSIWCFRADSQKASITISAEKLATPAEAVAELAGVGFDVTKETFMYFQQVVYQQAEAIQTSTPIHSQLGWYYDTNLEQLGYLASRSIYKPNIERNKSVYFGAYDIGMNPEKPEKDGWKERKEFLKSDILGHDKLECVCLVALSAATIGLLHNYGKDTLNPIVHLKGDSSQGKTTAAYLGISVAGKPFNGTIEKNIGNQRKRVSSLFRSWNATENAISALLAGNEGVPIAFDELGNFRGNLDNLTYSMGNGTEKSRANSDSTLCETSSFHTAILSTGEISIREKIKGQNTGKYIRFMEIPGPFTESAEHSRRIKKAAQELYGYELHLFATYLVNLSKEAVLEKYEESVREFRDKLPENASLADRIAEGIGGILLTTAYLAEQALKLPFDKEKLCKLIIDNVLTEELTIGRGERSFEKVIEWMDKNIEHFKKIGSGLEAEEPKCKPAYGTYTIKPSKDNPNSKVVEYVIRPDYLEQALKENNYSLEVLDEWAKKGYIIPEKGKKLYNRSVIEKNGHREKVYKIQYLSD